jgi:hypothetical protein
VFRAERRRVPSVSGETAFAWKKSNGVDAAAGRALRDSSSPTWSLAPLEQHLAGSDVDLLDERVE